MNTRLKTRHIIDIEILTPEKINTKVYTYKTDGLFVLSGDRDVCLTGIFFKEKQHIT